VTIRLSRAKNRAALMTEWVVAMGVFTLACLPLAFEFMHEKTLCHAYYQRAVAMEIVDGEMEMLAAGEWRAFKPGKQPYTVKAESVTNLPPGEFVLTLAEDRLRLEWSPKARGKGGAVVREVKLK
jgi:hypothetical protein